MATVTPEMLAELASLAEKATPGKRYHCCADGNGCGGRFVWLDESGERGVQAIRGGEPEPTDDQDRADLDFIAACDPSTVIALVAALREAQERLKGATRFDCGDSAYVEYRGCEGTAEPGWNASPDGAVLLLAPGKRLGEVGCMRFPTPDAAFAALAAARGKA